MEKARLKIVQHSALWAAYGDALGFITELADNASLKRRIKASYVTSTVAWRRLVGGRFGAEIDLPAGCYSDDTQLRLATSRAIRGDGTFDVEAFAKIELPVWLSYALGAGKGSTVAAASLAHYNVNWFSNFFDQQKSRYVEGGGNGGAMRIQPHVWAATDKSKPETFISDIVRNVLCTHGHPRGILGAVFHALCLASAFEQHTVPGLEVWKQSINFFPTVAFLLRNDSDLSTFWVPTWEGYTRVSIEEAFEEVKKEALLDIEIVQKCISGKPEESYSKLVEIIGGLKNELRGSGMKTAIIAAALSWMYRNEDPAKALITAANLLSSDTDTIATMAGAVLGVVADQPPSGEVLDRDYINSEATRLHSISCHYPTESFVYPDLFKWQPPKNQLDTVGLVDNRLGVAGLALAEKKGQEYKGRGSSDAVWQWLRLDFGQFILAKRRTYLKPLPVGNLLAKSIFPKHTDTLAAKADPIPEAIPTPREVFDRPEDYWSFLTTRVDNDFEGQHFDRKEAGQIYADGGTSKSQAHNIIEHVTVCISAFANSNIEGGLLVLGIASDGSVKGVRHLSQHQQNSITDFDSLLNNQSSEAKFYDCSDETGVVNRILLIYTPYTERAICETPGRNPKAWTRNGSQNVPLTQATRDRLGQLKLVSNAEAREVALLSTLAYSTEFANLYPLNIRQGNKPLDKREFQVRYKEFLTTFRDVLRVHGWYIDQFSFSRIVAHRRGVLLDIPKAASLILRLYPAYECQVREYSGHQYLCVDYTVQVLNVYSLDKLLSYFPVKDFIDHPCVAKQNGWKEGKILVCDQEWAKVFFSESEDQEQVPSSAVIPRCSLRMLDSLLRKEHVPFDLYQAIKQHSLASQPAAARMRAEKIASMAEYAVDSLFPITFGDFEVGLNRQPVHLVEHSRATQAVLPVRRLAEPMVEFRDQHTSTDVRDGITRFGAYGNKPHTIELVPLCISPHRRHMEQLIERLKVGKYKYRGAERTFAIRFTYSAIVTVEGVEAIRQEVERILIEHPDWIGDKSLSRIFLVHTPEQGYAADDESSPYYVVKRLLFEKGIPCQMVDTPTLVDPNWKDLNLALNITAKCGVTPWVLPDGIPDADFFVGLSYTQSQDRQRVMGFVNVFNRFGKWEFYSGNTVSFDNEERAENLAKLVRETLQRLTLSLTPNIIFHYSARFSHDDRTAILEAARSVRPQGTYTFVWINSHHNVCFFDSRAESDGSMRRGSYVQTSPHQVFLSTTGYNPFRRAMWTSKPLQINARVCRPEGAPNAEPDMKSLAVQVLSLTKLNWASTDAFCGEPITLKYARDIAYLTAAFLRQSEAFKLHPALEQTPWFL